VNKEEQEARELCAECNWVDTCKDCICIPKDCEEWRYYLNNTISRLRKLLCYIGLHNWYKYRSSKLRRCKVCGKAGYRRDKVKWDFETIIYYRNLWLR